MYECWCVYFAAVIINKSQIVTLKPVNSRQFMYIKINNHVLYTENKNV